MQSNQQQQAQQAFQPTFTSPNNARGSKKSNNSRQQPHQKSSTLSGSYTKGGWTKK